MTTTTDSIRVLHVDDDPGFADLTATVLEREDRLTVETATSADDGLASVTDRPPDCVVSDYNMPGMDGIEFLRAVRAEYSDLPFILFTGKGSEAVASEAIRAGVTDYLRKGSGTEQYELLINRIENAVRGRQNAERATQQEELMRATEFTADTGGWELDLETDELWLTDGTCRLLELPEGASLSLQQALELYHPEDRPEVRAALDRAVETRDTVTGTWRLQTLEGDQRRLAITITPVSSNGDVTALRGAVHDVTERHQRKRELEQTETLFEHAQDSLFLVRVAGGFQIERVNEAWEEVTGLAAERVRGQTPTELLGTQQGEAVEARFRECVDRREPLQYEEQLEFGGDLIRLETKIAPVVVDERVEYIAGSTRDVTEQREQQRELHRLRQAIDDANVSITLADPSQEDDPLVYVNDAFEETTGYPPEETLGRDCRFLQGDETDPEKVAALREAIDEERSTTVELRNYRRDGTEFWNQVSITPIYDDGELVRFLGTQKDITERKERERELERYETMISASPDEVYTLDADGVLTSIIPPAGQETTESGHSPDELVGEHASIVMDEADVERGREHVRDILSSGSKETSSFEMDIVTVDGDRIPVENHIAALPSDDGFSGTVGVLRNIADRKERERELRRKNERLDEFSSIVSHELQNPLNKAVLGIELAQEEFESPHLHTAKNGLDRSLTLIDDLLTLAREGEQVGSTAPVDLETVAADAWATLETAEATLTVETDATIHADRSRLQQLLENLFKNAIEHGGTDVTVTVEETARGFSVEDSGTGLQDEDTETVFDVGYSTADAGTGLGLGIVAQIADGHGWEVAATDGRSGGARFEITGVDTME